LQRIRFGSRSSSGNSFLASKAVGRGAMAEIGNLKWVSSDFNSLKFSRNDYV
jgi:hypothetical protein